jgi:hypothetical protein
MTNETRSRNYTYADLYTELFANEDIILEDLLSRDLNALKRGLSSFKHKQNVKLLKDGLPVEERRIEYEVLAKDTKKGTIKLRVLFSNPAAVKAKLIHADGEL